MPHHDPTRGVLLVGHGTASEPGTRQFFALARQLAERLAPCLVEPAYLELQQPDIQAGIQRLAERGASSILVAPLLLFAAAHAKQDIPRVVSSAVATLRGKRPHIVQAAHLGCHESMIALSRLRFAEALADRPPVARESTALVLVGRGSNDELATAEMHDFARLRHDPDVAATVAVCFLAMAQPRLEETLSMIAARGLRRVVVQPHLLFAGELADTLQRAVAKIQRQRPDQEWLVPALLADSQDSAGGGNEFLLQALCDRVDKAAIRVVASGPCD